MNKSIALLVAFFFSALLHAQSLTGVWENDKKLISFTDNSAQFILKLFYGWYYDKEVSLESTVTTNTGEVSLELEYARFRTKQVYPISIINNDLFLEYYVKGSAFEQGQDPYQEGIKGFWRCAGNRYDIQLDEPRHKPEVHSYYFTEGYVYKIRYWITEMPYQEVSVSIYDGDVTLHADKYLQIGQTVYTCVTGRGVSVRNVEKIPYTQTETTLSLFTPTKNDYPFYITENMQIMSFAYPYMRKTDITDIDKLIDQMNARRAFPLSPPRIY